MMLISCVEPPPVVLMALKMPPKFENILLFLLTLPIEADLPPNQGAFQTLVLEVTNPPCAYCPPPLSI